MTEENKKKTKFRRTAKWKKFRKYLKTTRQVDAVTGRKLLSGFQVHHCDMNADHYEDLTDEYNFETLNRQSHDFIHWLYRYPDWRRVLMNTTKILEKMERLNKR